MFAHLRFAIVAMLACTLAPFAFAIVGAILRIVTVDTAADVFAFYVVRGFAVVPMFALFLFAIVDSIGQRRGLC